MLTLSLQSQINTLDKWDCYPVISTLYSGPARLLAGVVQVVAGGALALVSAAFAIAGYDSSWSHASANIQEVDRGLGNIVRAVIASVPFLGNLIIYLFTKSDDSDGQIVLQRDADGLYTLPHFTVPGFTNCGTIRGPEIKIRSGDFIIDTANGIVPNGWILR